MPDILKRSYIFLIIFGILFAVTGCFNITVTPKESPGPLYSLPPTTQPATSEPTQTPTPVPPPVILEFSATPDTILPGGSTTLKWSTQNANLVSIDNGIGNVALTGSRTVTPGTSTIYTLRAEGAGGYSIATAQVLVTTIPVLDLPVINSFYSNPELLIKGNSANLYWNVSNASQVEITPGIGTVSLSGSHSISPTSTTSYTLKASNSFGWRSKTITVVVTTVDLIMPPITFIKIFKPDLVVEYIKFESMQLKYRVKNNGTANAGPSKVELRIGTTVYPLQSVGELAVGASSSEFTQSPFLCALGHPVTVTVTADRIGEVAELDETNNQLSKTFCE